MSRIPDRELIKLSINGDSQAFSTLIKRVETPLVSLVRSEIPDPVHAEDVLQEILFDVWKGLKELRDCDRWTAWVMQIARNRCHDFFRSAERREYPTANSDLEPILNRRSKHGSLQADLLDTVLQTLSQAPPDHVEAAHLFYLEGLTIRQIAVQLGRPEGTIKRWLSHARSFVRSRLGLRRMRIERRNTMTFASIMTDRYPQQNTLCLPPAAFARFGQGGVSDVAVSPDGSLMAVASRIGVWLYDAHNDDFLTLIAVEGTGILNKIAFSPDGTRIAVGDLDGKTTLCDIETRKILNAFTHRAQVAALAFSPDGRLLATGSRDRTAKLWDVETETMRATIPHEDWITHVAFSPDGRLLTTASRNGSVALWNVETEAVHFTMPHKDWITHVAFSPDGRLLATSSADKISKLWDVETGENCWTATCEGSAESIVFSTDNQYVAMRPRTGTVDIRSVDDGTNASAAIHTEPWVSKSRNNPPAQHSQEMNGWIVTFSRNGEHLAGLDADNSLTLWNIANGEKIRTLERVTGHNLNISLFRGETVVCSPDGRYFVVSFFINEGQETVRLWNEGTIADFTPVQTILSAAVSPDGLILATGGWDRIVTLWNVETQTVSRTLKGHTGEIRTLAFSPDGKFLVSGGADNWIEHPESVARNTDGELVVIMKEGKTRYFAPDENHIDKTAKVWEIETGKNIATLENPSQVIAVMFSSNGHHIAAASRGNVSLWCTKTWRNFATLDVSKVESLAFSPNGTRLATGGSWQEQIKLWDVESGNLIAEFSGHKGNVKSLAFSPDGRLLASGSFDNTILMWDVTPYS